MAYFCNPDTHQVGLISSVSGFDEQMAPGAHIRHLNYVIRPQTVAKVCHFLQKLPSEGGHRHIFAPHSPLSGWNFGLSGLYG